MSTKAAFHAGQHVVDLALVDVADDRAAAAALHVELGDLALRALALRFEHRDARLAAVGGNQDCLFHLASSVLQIQGWALYGTQ
jgi:hypothetical protein